MVVCRGIRGCPCAVALRGCAFCLRTRFALLTEQQITRSWRTLFRAGAIDDELISKAEAMLDELRAESPLRHRLRGELDELIARRAKQQEAAAKPARRRLKAKTQS
jgi:hypothetical protein